MSKTKAAIKRVVDHHKKTKNPATRIFVSQISPDDPIRKWRAPDAPPWSEEDERAELAYRARMRLVDTQLAARDQRMRGTVFVRTAFYEDLARLALANLRLLKAFQYVEALKPGENDYGHRSILSHYPEIIESAKESLRAHSEAIFGTRDFGRTIEEDKYE